MQTSYNRSDVASAERFYKLDPFRREMMESLNQLCDLMGSDQLKACWYFQKLLRLPRSIREIMLAKVAEYHSQNEQWFTYDDYLSEGIHVKGELHSQFDMSRLPEEMQIYLPPIENGISPTDSVRRAVKRIRLSSL